MLKLDVNRTLLTRLRRQPVPTQASAQTEEEHSSALVTS
jgi:hypothetical protein